MLIFDRKELLQAVRSVAKILPKKSFSSLDSMVTLDYNSVSTSHGGTHVRIMLDSAMKSVETLLIPAKEFSELLNNLHTATVDICTVNKTVNGIKIQNAIDPAALSDDIEFEAAAASLDYELASELEVPQKELEKVLSQTLFALDGEADSITGVLLFDQGNVVATDSIRMSITRLVQSEGFSPIEAVVPAEPLRVLKSLLGKDGTVTIQTQTHGKILFVGDKFGLSTNMANVDYIHYRDIIPADQAESTVFINHRKDMLNALKVLKSGIDEKLNTVVIRGQDSTLSNGTDTVSAPFTWDGGEFSCNYEFLVQALNSFTTESLTAQFRGHYVVFVGQGEDKHYKHLLCGMET